MSNTRPFFRQECESSGCSSQVGSNGNSEFPGCYQVLTAELIASQKNISAGVPDRDVSQAGSMQSEYPHTSSCQLSLLTQTPLQTLGSSFPVQRRGAGKFGSRRCTKGVAAQ